VVCRRNRAALAASILMMGVVSVVTTGCSRSAARPAPSPELVSYAEWLAGKLQDEARSGSGGFGAGSAGTQFRADNGAVQMVIHGNSVSLGALVLYEGRLQGEAAEKFCKTDHIPEFIAKGGVFQIVADTQSGSTPLATVDHCDHA
jgi:hypothetical protein